MLEWYRGRTQDLGCDIRLLSDGTLKTTGTYYAVIYDKTYAKYWTGSAWSASLSTVALSHLSSGYWKYSLTSTAWIEGGQILLLRATENSDGSASTTVIATNAEGALAQTLSRAMLGDLVERQRGRHTWQSQMLYVAPTTGTTIAGGADGSRIRPVSTVAEALSLVTSRHAVINLVADNPSGSTTLTEAVTISSGGFIFLRGPGRDFLWTRSGGGDTISVNGVAGIELSGFRLGTAATGNGAGARIYGAADFTRISRLWIANTQGHGIHLQDCSHAEIEDCVLESAGQSNTGHGVVLETTSGTVANCRVSRCSIRDTAGDGVRVSGSVSHIEVCDNKIHGSTGYGVNLLSGSDIMICENAWGNNASGNLHDLATNTIQRDNEDVVPPSAIDIAYAVDAQLSASHDGGSWGNGLPQAVLSPRWTFAADGSFQALDLLISVATEQFGGRGTLSEAYLQIHDSTGTVLLTYTTGQVQTGVSSAFLAGDKLIAITIDATHASAAAFTRTAQLQLDLNLTYSGGYTDEFFDISPPAAPSASEIDAQLSGTHGAGAWGAEGTGAITVDFTATDADTAALLVGASLYVYDSTNAILVAGGHTDGSGVLSLYLPAGSYKLRARLAGYTFAAPIAFTVASDPTAVAVPGTALATAPTPAAPGYCAIYGTILSAGGDPAEGEPITAYSASVQSVSGAQLGDVIATTTIAADGTFSLPLAQGALVRLLIPTARIDQVLTVPSAASVDLVDWVAED